MQKARGMAKYLIVKNSAVFDDPSDALLRRDADELRGAQPAAAAEAPAPSRPKAQRPLITKRTALGDASNAARPKAATGRKRVDHSLRRSSGREPSDTSSVSSLFSLSEPSLAASFRSAEGSPAAPQAHRRYTACPHTRHDEML